MVMSHNHNVIIITILQASLRSMRAPTSTQMTTMTEAWISTPHVPLPLYCPLSHCLISYFPSLCTSLPVTFLADEGRRIGLQTGSKTIKVPETSGIDVLHTQCHVEVCRSFRNVFHGASLGASWLRSYSTPFRCYQPDTSLQCHSIMLMLLYPGFLHWTQTVTMTAAVTVTVTMTVPALPWHLVMTE